MSNLRPPRHPDQCGLSAPLEYPLRPLFPDPIVPAAHCNADDHKRFYGEDFADRLRAAGFLVEIFRITPAQEVKFGLLPMEWRHVATRGPAMTPINPETGGRT